MTRKTHLKNPRNGAVTCQGRTGGALRGEHITCGYAEFVAEPAEFQCSRCRASKVFAYLQRCAEKTAAVAPEPRGCAEMDRPLNPDAWEPVDDPEAWKAHDDALLAAHRARRT